MAFAALARDGHERFPIPKGAKGAKGANGAKDDEVDFPFVGIADAGPVFRYEAQRFGTRLNVSVRGSTFRCEAHREAQRATGMVVVLALYMISISFTAPAPSRVPSRIPGSAIATSPER